MKLFYALVAIVLPFSLIAQNEQKSGEAEQIIITKKGGTDKYIISVDGDKVTVNGEPADKNAQLTVKRHKIKDIEVYNDDIARMPGENRVFQRQIMLTPTPNKAMLGVSTRQTQNGVEVINVSEGSAAEKAGLKEGDIIAEVDRTKIETPDDLSKAIGTKNPGDNVTVVYFRNKKQNTAVAELKKWEAPEIAMGNNFNMNIPNIDLEAFSDRSPLDAPNMNRQFYFFNNPQQNFSGPKLGIKVQDLENGEGVKVLNVLRDSDAENAGIREGDIIREINGSVVTGTNNVAALLRPKMKSSNTHIKLERNGKMQEINVVMKKKIRTADL